MTKLEQWNEKWASFLDSLAGMEDAITALTDTVKRLVAERGDPEVQATVDAAIAALDGAKARVDEDHAALSDAMKLATASGGPTN